MVYLPISNLFKPRPINRLSLHILAQGAHWCSTAWSKKPCAEQGCPSLEIS